MMRRAMTFVATVLLTVSAIADADAVTSQPVYLNLQPDRTPLWRTIPGGARWVEWVMPQDATKATLTVVSDFGGQTVYSDLSEPSNLVYFASALANETEDVVTLTLSFDNGDVQTAKIGVLSSASETSGTSASAICRYVAGGVRAWSRVCDHAVLPVPYGTRVLEIRGGTVDTGLAGAAGWHGVSFSMADHPASLSLETGDGTFIALLDYHASGMVLHFR